MSLLQMSFSGGIMILVVIVIRSLTIHALPKKTFLALWFVCILRLLIPFSIPSAFSAYTFLVERPMVREQIMERPATNVLPVKVSAPPNATRSIASEGKSTNEMVDASKVISIVWLVGAGAVLLVFALAYVHCAGRLRDSFPISNTEAGLWLKEHRLRRKMQIRSSSKIESPLTYGLMNPIILVPKDMDWSDDKKVEYMLTHEYTHIRRLDMLRKLLLILAVSVHWFNPMVWFLFTLANRDIELACDEDVLGWCGLSQRSDYARMLVHMQEKRLEPAPQVLGFSRTGMEERITAIMKTKQTSLGRILTAILIIIIVGNVFATSANASIKPDRLMKRQYSNGTREDYASLFTLRLEEGEECTMEEFRAQLVEWVREDYARSERVREDVVRGDFNVPLTEDEEDYLILTYVLLGEENVRKAASIMVGGSGDGSASWVGDCEYDNEDGIYYAYVWEKLYNQFLYRLENPEYVKVDSNVYDDRYGEQPDVVKMSWSVEARGKKKFLSQDETKAEVTIYADENSHCINAQSN